MSTALKSYLCKNRDFFSLSATKRIGFKFEWEIEMLPAITINLNTKVPQE
jgi:hypothetical protein